MCTKGEGKCSYYGFCQTKGKEQKLDRRKQTDVWGGTGTSQGWLAEK